MGFDFNRDCRSPAVAVDLVRMLRLLDGDRELGAIRSNGIWFDTAYQMYLYEENAFRTRTLFVRYPGVEMVLFAGVRRADTARRLFTSYFERPLTAFKGVPLWMIDNGNFYKQSLLYNPEFPPATTIWLVGHSFGGAIAQVTAGRYPFGLPPQSPTLRVVTFGAPRIYAGEGVDDFNASAIVHARWYNDNDPVRHMPPHSNEAPTLHAATTRVMSDRVNAFNQTSTGLCLRDSGVIERRGDTPEIRPIAEASLITWATGVMDTTQRDHSLATYETRLALAVAAAPPPAFVPMNAPARLDPPPPAPPRQDAPVVQAARDAAIVAARDRQEQNTETIAVPQFRPLKRNGIWCVTWEGDTIVIAASRSRARFIARRGNALLRDLPNDDLIDLDVAFQAVKRMS